MSCEEESHTQNELNLNSPPRQPVWPSGTMVRLSREEIRSIKKYERGAHKKEKMVQVGGEEEGTTGGYCTAK